MGACEFNNVAVGSNVDEAFSRTVQDAQYEHGHGGYSGTIAEKGSYRLFPLPDITGASPYAIADFVVSGIYGVEDGEPWEIVSYSSTVIDGRYQTTSTPIPESQRRVLRAIHDAVDDKWGPAGAFDITSTPEGQKHLGQWLEQQKRSGMFEVDHRGNHTRVGPEPTTDGLRVFLFFGTASS